MPAYRCFPASTTGIAGVVAMVMTALSAPLHGVFARESGDPIQLKWMEGDVAGMTAIWSPDATKVIGFVEYHQHRLGDRLEATRIGGCDDGPCTEYQDAASVGASLTAMR